jgi:hypothetical protein
MLVDRLSGSGSFDFLVALASHHDNPTALRPMGKRLMYASEHQLGSLNDAQARFYDHLANMVSATCNDSETKVLRNPLVTMRFIRPTITRSPAAKQDQEPRIPADEAQLPIPSPSATCVALRSCTKLDVSFHRRAARMLCLGASVPSHWLQAS